MSDEVRIHVAKNKGLTQAIKKYAQEQKLNIDFNSVNWDKGMDALAKINADRESQSIFSGGDEHHTWSENFVVHEGDIVFSKDEFNSVINALGGKVNSSKKAKSTSRAKNESDEQKVFVDNKRGTAILHSKKSDLTVDKDGNLIRIVDNKNHIQTDFEYDDSNNLNRVKIFDIDKNGEEIEASEYRPSFKKGVDKNGNMAELKDEAHGMNVKFSYSDDGNQIMGIDCTDKKGNNVYKWKFTENGKFYKEGANNVGLMPEFENVKSQPKGTKAFKLGGAQPQPKGSTAFKLDDDVPAQSKSSTAFKLDDDDSPHPRSTTVFKLDDDGQASQVKEVKISNNQFVKEHVDGTKTVNVSSFNSEHGTHSQSKQHYDKNGHLLKTELVEFDTLNDEVTTEVYSPDEGLVRTELHNDGTKKQINVPFNGSGLQITTELAKDGSKAVKIEQFVEKELFDKAAKISQENSGTVIPSTEKFTETKEFLAHKRKVTPDGITYIKQYLVKTFIELANGQKRLIKELDESSNLTDYFEYIGNNLASRIRRNSSDIVVQSEYYNQDGYNITYDAEGKPFQRYNINEKFFEYYNDETQKWER